MASSEGDFNLNQGLSCYRARTAAFLLESAGLVNTIRSIEALGEIYNTNNDPKFRAVDIDVMTLYLNLFLHIHLPLLILVLLIVIMILLLKPI